MAIGNGQLMHERFPQMLAHVNSKNEIRQRHRRRQDEKSEYGRKYSGHEKRKSRRPNCSSGGSLLPEAVDELHNEPNLHL